MTQSNTPTKPLDAFQIFDDRAKNSLSYEPSTKAQAKSYIRSLIDALPQRSVIDESDIARWINITYASSEERLRDEGVIGSQVTVQQVYKECLWHVRRASGFGGSESSAVLAHYEGGQGGFESARNIVAGKLLKMAPMKGTVHMRRGVRAEDMIQSIFLKQSGSSSQDRLLQKLRDYRWSKFPMMIGTPDDIIQTLDGRCKVVDYKAPSEAVFKEIITHGAPHQYVCQLHHYYVIAASAGIKFHGMGLVPFNSQEWSAQELDVPVDQDLYKSLVRSCVLMWRDFVMKAELPLDPDPIVLNEVEDPDVTEALRRTAVQSTLLMQVGKALDSKSKGLRATVGDIVSDKHDLATGDVDLGYAKMTRVRTWDHDKLREIAVSVGLDFEDFLVDDPKKVDAKEAVSILTKIYDLNDDDDAVLELVSAIRENGPPKIKVLDTDAIIEAIEDAGGSTLEAAGVTERLMVSRKKNGPEFEMVCKLDLIANGLAQAVDNSLIENIDELHADIMRLPDAPNVDASDMDFCVGTF